MTYRNLGATGGSDENKNGKSDKPARVYSRDSRGRFVKKDASASGTEAYRENPESQEAFDRLKFKGASEEEKDKIVTILCDSFAPKELDVMTSGPRKHDIEVVDCILDENGKDTGDSGAYDPAHNTITYTHDNIDPLTVTHEAVHEARATDFHRKRGITKSRSKIGLDPDNNAVEEACTTAETIARMSPYDKKVDPSYNNGVANSKKEARRMMDEDRRLFIGDEDLGDAKIRDMAVESVRKNFNKSNISDFKIKDGRTVKQFLDDCGDNDGDREEGKGGKKTHRSREGRSFRGLQELPREVQAGRHGDVPRPPPKICRPELCGGVCVEQLEIWRPQQSDREKRKPYGRRRVGDQRESQEED